MANTPTLEITTDIILIDVVGYSLLPNEEQLRTVKEIGAGLSTWVHFLAELSDLRKEEVFIGFIPTGDGMYVLLNPSVCGYGLLLGLSIRNYLVWNSECFLKGSYKGVRVGINTGKMLPFDDVNGTQNFVGDGLNDCARLLKIEDQEAIAFSGDTSYVVASESAYYWFRQLYTGGDASRFLSTIRFRISEQKQITDKHDKTHTAYLVEASRSVALQPPNRAKRKKETTASVNSREDRH
jgi:hypothetical protein